MKKSNASRKLRIRSSRLESARYRYQTHAIATPLASINCARPPTSRKLSHIAKIRSFIWRDMIFTLFASLALHANTPQNRPRSFVFTPTLLLCIPESRLEKRARLYADFDLTKAPNAPDPVSQIMISRSTVTLVARSRLATTNARDSLIEYRATRCKKARRFREIRVNTITGRTTGNGAQEVSEIAEERGGAGGARCGGAEVAPRCIVCVCVFYHRGKELFTFGFGGCYSYAGFSAARRNIGKEERRARKVKRDTRDGGFSSAIFDTVRSTTSHSLFSLFSS